MRQSKIQNFYLAQNIVIINIETYYTSVVWKYRMLRIRCETFKASMGGS